MSEPVLIGQLLRHFVAQHRCGYRMLVIRTWRDCERVASVFPGHGGPRLLRCPWCDADFDGLAWEDFQARHVPRE
jgi:hypothetical protein